MTKRKPDPINVHLPNMPSALALTHDSEGLSMEFSVAPGTTEAIQLAHDLLYAGARLAGIASTDAHHVASLVAALPGDNLNDLRSEMLDKLKALRVHADLTA